MWYVHGAFLHPIDFAEAGEKVTATNAATRTRYFIVFSQCWARMKLGHFPSGDCEVVHSAVQKRIGVANRPKVHIFRRMFKAFEFCLPTLGKSVPAGPEWFHEIKYDGYRLRIERDGDRVCG